MFRGYRKTKKNIKKIENTIDSIRVPLYNIDKLKRVSEQLKSGLLEQSATLNSLLPVEITKERSVTILQDSNKKIK